MQVLSTAGDIAASHRWYHLFSILHDTHLENGLKRCLSQGQNLALNGWFCSKSLGSREGCCGWVSERRRRQGAGPLYRG